ncbi:hypothetical protein EUTSA_v10005379mg, partial [Eutrema salsugineum]
VSPTRSISKWSSPSHNFLKCNYDASHHDGTQNSGLGWIIRNSNGVFLDGGMGKFQGRHCPEKAEYKLNLIRKLNKNEVNLKLQHYLSTIQNWRHMFEAVKFSYSNRDANSCADLHARKAVSDTSPWSILHVFQYFYK